MKIDREKAMEDLQSLCEYLFHEYNVCYKGDEEDTYNRFLAANNALNLLKEQEKELTLDDLDTLVNMIAIKAKAEGRFFSPYEVGLALVAHGQHDERFEWGEVIKYSPCEVERILNEVMKDD